MATIYLIRHGQASFGQSNYDQLSELGVQQAIRLGEVTSQRLQLFDKVVLGTMKRHKQTAQSCLAGFGVQLENVNLHYDSAWNEYDLQAILAQLGPNFSTPETMITYLRKQQDPKKAFEFRFNQAIDRWIAYGDGSAYPESWEQFKARVRGAFELTIKDAKKAKNIAVFTSGGPIALVTQDLLGVDDHKMVQVNWTLLNCGVSKVVSTGSRAFLASLNEHTHFESRDYKKYITYT